VPLIGFAHLVPAHTPRNVSHGNPLALNELTTLALAAACAIKEMGPYMYLLDERGDRQLMLFNNAAVFFSKSDTKKFVDPKVLCKYLLAARFK